MSKKWGDHFDDNNEQNSEQNISRESQILNTKIDWTICILCQDPKDKDLRSTDTGLATLSKQFIKLKNHGGIIRSESQSFDDESILYNFLQNNKALYHKNCYGKYSEDKLKKIISKSNDTKVAETKYLWKHSLDRNLGDLQRGICGAFDIQKNLYMAADVKRKNGTKVNEHLKAKTEDLHNLAKTSGYENLHAMICVCFIT